MFEIQDQDALAKKIAKVVLTGVAGLGALDLAAWVLRLRQRAVRFEQATKSARESGRPLLIAGRPNGWTDNSDANHSRHGCGNLAEGDVVIDIAPAPECPNALQANLENLTGIPDGYFGAAFIGCTLEHVDDLNAAWAEIRRVTDGPIYAVVPQVWAPFAWWFPTHRWVLLALPKEGAPTALRIRGDHPLLSDIEPIHTYDPYAR